ncbi:MAG: hypothetical protein OWQ48_03240 [Desulfurococcus sp.]|nr:hypothetical protein [Desulfurococcus sp.]
MIRDLAYMFLTSRRDLGFSTLGKILYSSSIIILLVLSRNVGNPLVYTTYPVVVLLVELIFLSVHKGYRVVFSGLKLMLVFVMLGVLLFMLSSLVGTPAPSAVEIIVGSIRMIAFFLAFTLFFQLITIREWLGILAKLGLHEYAVVLALTLSQVPLMLVYFSEAHTAVSLKYGKKTPGVLVTPLIYHSALTARSRLEALLQYPIRPLAQLTVFRWRDIYLYIIVLILALLLVYGYI